MAGVPAIPFFMTKLRAALIGTGNIARQHVRGLRAHADRVDLVAVQDIDAATARTFAAEHSIPTAHADIATLLAHERPNLVHICTPPHVHAALALASMEAGAHVVCEKPLCASLAELDRLQAAEHANGRFCATVFQMRYGSSAGHVRRALAAGEAGRPLVAVCHTLWYRSAEYYRVPWRGKWGNELGGPTVGQGIHTMDQLLFLLGPWRRVTAVARTSDRDIEVEDVSVALVEFESGCVASIVNSVLSPRQETYIRIDAQHATLELTHLYSYKNESWRFTAGTTADPAAFGRLAALPPDVPADHVALVGGLLDDIAAGTAPVTTGAEARTTLDLLTAIYKSALTREPVARGSIVPGDPFYTSFHGGLGDRLRS